MEEKISVVTGEKKLLEANLALPEIYSDNQKFLEAEKKYNQKVQELTAANANYEALFEKMMMLEEQLS